MNEMTHLTADERELLAKAKAVVPQGAWSSFYKAKYNEWHVSVPAEDSDTMRISIFPDGCVGGQTYAEHVAAASPIAIAKLLADLNTARAKLAALTIEHEHAMQALMLGEDEAKKELLAARAKLAKLPRTADGVEIVPGASVYTLTGELIIIAIVDMFEFDGPVYSTRESALAAKDAAEGRVG